MTSTDSISSNDLPEAGLAHRLGIAREDLKKIRAALVEGVDWIGGTGRPVLYTSTGQIRVAHLLAEKKEAAAPPMAPVQHTLVILRVTSPRTLLAEKKDAAAGAGGEPLRVIVRDSKNFIAGMVIGHCEASDDAPGVFYYHGRLPRRRGHL